MSESAFNFKGAPSSNLGRQFVAWGGLKKAFGSKSGNGLSARDQSALMRQQASHNIETSVLNHVLGETAADAAHKRSMQATRLGNKSDMQKDYQQRLFAGSEANAQREHAASESSANRQHEIDRTERLTSAVSSNKDIRSFNPSTGAVVTTHPMQEGKQFNGVGEA
jgi:hypothetical protein